MPARDGGERQDSLAPVIPLFGGEAPARSGASASDAASWNATWADELDDDEYGEDAYDEDAGEASDGLRDRAEKTLLKKLRTRSLSVVEARAVVAEHGLDSDATEELLQAFLDRGYLDDVALTDAQAKTKNLANDLYYNPDTGAITRRGKDGLTVSDDFLGQYDAEVEKLERGLSPRARTKFQQFRASHRGEFQTRLQMHEFREQEELDKVTFKTGLEAADNDAILNHREPGKVATSLEEKRRLIEAHADRMGYSPEVREHLLKTEVSKTHTKESLRLCYRSML